MKRREVTQSLEQLQKDLKSGKFVPRPDDSVLATFQGDEGVLLDYSRGEYYGLNAVAASVWKLLCAGRSFSAIVDDLVRSYDVSANTATHDVTRLVADLLARGIIHVDEVGP